MPILLSIFHQSKELLCWPEIACLYRLDTEESSAATSFDVLLAIEGRDNEDSSSSGGTSVFNIAIFLCVVAVGLLL